MNEKPANITVNKKTREFTVNWDDGHVSIYPFSLLRDRCGCAACTATRTASREVRS